MTLHLDTARINQAERAATMAVGGTLVGAGLARRSLAGAALAMLGSNLVYRGVRGQSLLSGVLGRDDAADGQPIPGTVQRSITIGCAVDDLQRRWRDADTLRRIAPDGVEVSMLDEGTTRWRFSGTPVNLIGSVDFREAPSARGTEMTLRLAPEHSGALAAMMESMQLVPKTVAGMSLRHFKSLVETGEIPTLERNPSARAGGES